MMTQQAPSPSWTLAELLSGFAAAPFASEARIEHLTLDSRSAGPGALFLACRGTRGHGLRYAAQAAQRGCAAIAAEPDARWGEDDLHRIATELALPVVAVPRLSRRAGEIAARFYADPSASVPVIGVTGTNGKTSVSYFLAQCLGDQRCALIGTLGCGFPGEIRETGLTTPDAVALQRILAGLRALGAHAVAMEVSSHALEQHRADAVHFDTAVFTNLSRDHLDYHRDMAHYAAAKRRLFRMPGLRWAVLNHDDEGARAAAGDLAEDVARAGFSLEPAADLGDYDCWVRARKVDARARGQRIEIDSSAGSGLIESALIGRFNAANLLAVLAVLLARGRALDASLEALGRLTGVPGRMECFGDRNAPLVVVDYAHTPDALEKALLHLREHRNGRVVTVFGCGGERDPGKRALMGAVAERLSDEVVLTDDNPRQEDGDAIIAAIRAGMRAPERARVQRQRALAIRRAIALAGCGDAVLIAGKGHETVLDMGELKVHFSDRAQVVQALREREGDPA